jgi:TonB family protein
MNQRAIGWVALVLSVCTHAWVIQATPAAPRVVKREHAPAQVQFTVASLPPPAPTPALPEHPVEPTVAPSPRPAPVLEQAPTAEELVVPVEPNLPGVELTGTTLVAEGPGSFGAASGSGEARQGSLVGGALPATRRQGAPQPARPAPPSVATVPLAELSKKPAPPSLGDALRANYPAAARAQGRTGEAKVRARIEASGRVLVAQVSTESAGEFGAACRKTLLGSKWSAPVDHHGKPVATWVSYRCKFRVGD